MHLQNHAGAGIENHWCLLVISLALGSGPCFKGIREWVIEQDPRLWVLCVHKCVRTHHRKREKENSVRC